MTRFALVLALVLVAAAPAATPLRVQQPFYLAVDRNGTVLVADGQARRVLRVNPKTKAVTNFLPRVKDVLAVAVSGSRVYMAQHDTDVILRVEGGKVTTISPKLGGPVALAVAPDGSVVVAEYRGRVQRIAPDGGLTLVAGRGVEASDGDGGDPTAAGIDRPHGVAVARDGTVYVADTYAGKVRKIADGAISTIAAGLANPVGLAVDRDGSVLVAEMEGRRVTRIGPDGRTSTVTARILYPNAIAVAPNGTLYVGSIRVGKVYRVDRRTGSATPVTR